MSSTPKAIPGWLRLTVDLANGLIAKSIFASRVYLATLFFLSRARTQKFKNRLLSSLSRVSWPATALVPREVMLGSGTSVIMQPHNNEFDFAAILGGSLDYEENVFNFLATRMDRYDAVVEIGANVGVFTLFFAKQLARHNSAAKVYCFEPSLTAFERLLHNLSLNSVTNVHPFNLAIAEHNGFDFFYEPAGHLTNGSMRKDFAELFSHDVQKKPVVFMNGDSLDNLLAGAKNVLLKIDVEGAEPQVLASLAGIFARYQPDTIIEILAGYEEPIAEVLQKIAGDYQYFSISANGLTRQQKLLATAERDYFISCKA